MPSALIIYSLYYFLIALQLILLLFLILGTLSILHRVTYILAILSLPVLVPVRLLLNRSIFYSRTVDFAPIITIIILNALQNFLGTLLP